MLSRDSQRNLSDLLMKIIEGENKIEILRKCLCDNTEFSPRVLFQSLANLYPSSVLPKDLKDFLSQNSIEVTDQEIYLLVRQYSSQQNGRLSSDDFQHFVVTSTEDSLGELVLQRYLVREVRPGVKYSFLSLLREEISMQREVESLKIKMFQEEEFSLWKAFECLNSAGKGYVDERDVAEFLKGFGRYIGSNDFDALMRRIDIEDDLVISYNEFLEALIPLSVPRHQQEKEKEKGKGEGEGKGKGIEKKSEREREKEIEKNEEEDKGSRKNEEESEEIIERNRRELELLISEPREISKESGEDGENDEPLVSHDLGNSPRFREAYEISADKEQYDTPIKNKDETPRQHQIKTKNIEFSQQIGEIMAIQLDNERSLEYNRQNLVMQENFSIDQAFKLIDKEERGFITLYDFQIFLDSINLQAEKADLVSIFKKYCGDKDLEIGQDELLKIFLPHDPEYREFLKLEQDEVLNQVTIEKIRDVLEVLVLSEERLRSYREIVAQVSEEELKEIFAKIDTDEDGELSSEDLKRFFKEQGRNISEKDRARIIELYSEENNTIFFNEFKNKISA